MSLLPQRKELSQESPPPSGDVSIQSNALIAIWVLFGITSVVMILRIFSQLKVLRRPGLDDGLMILAWICQAINSALNTVAIHWGTGRHSFYLTQEQHANAVKYDMLAIPWGILCPMFGRISFIVFLLVFIMTVSRVRKTLLWALIVIEVIFNIIPIIVVFVQCQPVSRLWDPSIPGKCWRPDVVRDVGYVQGALNAATDFCLTAIGTTLVLSLNLRLCAKISLSVLLSLSILAMVAAILKTVKMEELGHFDRTYPWASWIYWYLVENAVVIITASIPKIRPLFILLRQKYAESRYQRRRKANEDLEGTAPSSKSSKYLFGWSYSGTGAKGTQSSSVGRDQDPMARYYSSWSGTTADHRRERQRSIYNIPRRGHRRGENISMTSLSRSRSRSRPSSTKLRRSHSPSPSDNNLIPMTTNDFLPALSPRFTSRTVISGGGPVPPSVPASVLSSAAPSGRTSRTSMRDDIPAPSQPQISIDLGEGQPPLMVSGPFCIWETTDFVVQIENVDENSGNNNNNNNNNGAGMRVLPNYDVGEYNESEAQGLQLYDEGGILGQGHNHDRHDGNGNFSS